MNKRWMICIVLVSVMLVGTALMRLKDNRMITSSVPEPSPSPVATHRQQFPGGFLLMFDEPITQERDGTKVTILGIGRAKVNEIRDIRDLETNLSTYKLKARERMIVLLKLSGDHCLYSNVRSSWGDTQTGDWRSNAFWGAGSLQLPFNVFDSHFKEDTGIRIQPIIGNLPERKETQIIPDLDRYQIPHVVSIRLDQIPYYGPMTINDLKSKTLKLGKAKIRFYDWLIDNPGLITHDQYGDLMWEGGHIQIPQRMQDRKYLSLRFLYASSSEYWASHFYAVVYGSNGEKVLLERFNQWSGADSPGYWLGMDLSGRYSSDRSLVLDYKYTVKSVDPTGPAAKAGIKRGDRVMCEGEGAPINRSSGMKFDRHLEVGVPITLKIYAFRSNETRTVTITPVERPENDLFLEGIEIDREAMFQELLKDIPHTGDPITGIRVSGDARMGYIRLISCDPIPAGFKPIKVSLYTEESFRTSSGTPDKPAALRGFNLHLPNIPIPSEFWK